MPTPEESKRAGYHDVAVWGDKETDGAYPPGTTFDLGDGQKVDVTKVPDVIGGKAPAKRARRSK